MPNGISAFGSCNSFSSVGDDKKSSEQSEKTRSLLLWEKGDHEVVDEELSCVKDTSSVSRQAAATFPHWGRRKK
jgi:hypothetical protein